MYRVMFFAPKIVIENGERSCHAVVEKTEIRGESFDNLLLQGFFESNDQARIAKEKGSVVEYRRGNTWMVIINEE